MKLLAQNPKVDVGLHFAITNEWDYIKMATIDRLLTSEKVKVAIHRKGIKLVSYKVVLK